MSADSVSENQTTVTKDPRTRARILRVPCPVCGVKRNERCVNLSAFSYTRPLKSFHNERVQNCQR